MNIVKEMSVLELSELVKAFEEEFGVTAAAPMAVPVAGAAPGAAAEPEEEKLSLMLSLLLQEIRKSLLLKLSVN